MRPEEDRTVQIPSLVDVNDEEQLRAIADHLEASPEDVSEAVAAVGPNLHAVELWLSAPE
jgi:hypothetical protein